MSQYSQLTKAQAIDAISSYTIGEIKSLTRLKGGSENTNYLLETNSEKYALCICEQKSKREAEDLARLLIHLESNEFGTSKIIKTKNGELLDSWEGKPLMLRSFLEGNIIQDLTPDLLHLIGSELARLHQIPVPDFIPTTLNYGKEQFGNVASYAPDSEMIPWLDNILKQLAPHLDKDLPKALIHSDLFWDNVIISEDQTQAMIMDFEEAAYYYRVFDVGMTIIGTCADKNEIDLDKAGHLLNGYQSTYALTTDEISALKAFTIYAGASMTYWRHQNFNHVKPDPAMYDHYKGLKILVDFLSDLEDDCLSKLTVCGK